ncbi:DUF664 domain-containing protein [Mobilicoccus sp.]|uniref:mycothiol transferase n=1 Tax=Mobilicoccus sp. TaxID=2034349 RepID=UPI0028B21E70|nr:DUF664 domain-containing protein [Mobilicoccus sp.]
MPALTPATARDEGEALRTFVLSQLDGMRAVTFGLTDDQGRATPTTSALSVGGLLKHVVRCTDQWFARFESAPERTERDTLPAEEAGPLYAEEFVMQPDETLGALVAEFDRLRARIADAAADLDLDAEVPVPTDAPWWPQDLDAWNVRWGLLHLVEEIARHAGHADIIREHIDGATTYELVAGLEGEDPSAWLVPTPPHPGSYDAERRRNAEPAVAQG